MCYLFSFRFRTEQSLTKISVICEICEESFSNRAILKRHRTYAHNNKFPCQTCGKIFYGKSKFNSHLKIHTGDKPFSCDICEKSFKRKDGLNKHNRLVHENESVPLLDSTIFVDCGENIDNKVKEELIIKEEELEEELITECDIEEKIKDEYIYDDEPACILDIKETPLIE